MVNINIRVKGMRELKAYMQKLPIKVEKEIFRECSSIMNDMYKNMKLMAPENTGFLKSQININNNNKDRIVINTGDAYYAIYQEMGYSAHLIPLAYLSQHALSPNTPGVYTSNTGGAFVNVNKNTPFVEPAFVQAMNNFNSKLNIALERGLQ